MTCEACAAHGRTFRLVGTTEALCVDCFLAAHPPTPDLPSRRGCLSDLRRRPQLRLAGRCRSV